MTPPMPELYAKSTRQRGCAAVGLRAVVSGVTIAQCTDTEAGHCRRERCIEVIGPLNCRSTLT